jgi:hypothetical protein
MRIKDIQIGQKLYYNLWYKGLPRVYRGEVLQIEDKLDAIKIQHKNTYVYQLAQNLTPDRKTARKWAMLMALSKAKLLKNEIEEREKLRTKLGNFLRKPQ